MVVHFDNETPCTAKCTIDYLRVNRLTPAPHPAFSLDLTPSDFYLSGKLKMVLMGAVFAHDELLQDVIEVLNGISREELEAVVEESLLRLDRRVQQNREYVESGKFNKHIFVILALSCVVMLKFSGMPCISCLNGHISALHRRIQEITLLSRSSGLLAQANTNTPVTEFPRKTPKPALPSSLKFLMFLRMHLRFLYRRNTLLKLMQIPLHFLRPPAGTLLSDNLAFYLWYCTPNSYRVRVRSS
jgi:hypothetical protein